MNQNFLSEYRMKTFVSLTVVLVQLTLSSTAGARQWKARTGSFATEAEFVAVKNGKVYLEREDGAVLSHPVQSLSDDDCDYLRALTRSNTKLSKFLREYPLPTRHTIFLSATLSTSCRSLDFSPDGRMLAVGTDDSLSMVDLTKWTMDSVELNQDNRGVHSCRFSSSSDTLLTEDGSRNLRTWSVESPTTLHLLKEYQRLPYGSGTFAFVCERKQVLRGGRYWSLENGVNFLALGEYFKGRGRVWFVNPKGTQALGMDGMFLVLFDLETGKPIQKMALAKSYTVPSAFSPNGQVVAVSHSNEIHLWNVVKGAKLPSIIPPSATSSLKFTPDSQHLIGSCYDTLRIWRVSDGQLIHVLEKAERASDSVIAISPESKYVAISTGSDKRTIQIFKVPESAE